MIPHNRLSQPPSDYVQPTASSSIGQASSEHSPASITDLTRQFTLTIGGTSGQPNMAIATFVVPPRVQPTEAGLTDQQIIKMFEGMGTQPDQFLFATHDDGHGGRTLTLTPRDAQTNLPAPVVRLNIGRDNALQSFTLNTGEHLQSAQFQQKLPSPQDFQRQLPGRLGVPRSDKARTGMKRTITPPHRSPDSRQWTGSAAGPSTQSWSHAALQRQAQEQQDISDTIHASLAQFGMDWQALSPERQSEVWNAAAHLPLQAPVGTREQQILAVVERMQLPQTMASLSSLPERQAVVYDAQVAANHWVGVRKDEFDPHRKRWNAATNESHSGAAILQCLSSLCDAELAQGRDAEVTGSGGLVFEFTVTLPGMLEPMTVWRQLDDNGVPDLRLAPAPGNDRARAKLLKQMQNSAATRAGRRREKLATAVGYGSKSAVGHWNGVRKAEFGQYLEEWNTATGKSYGGGAMLQCLSELCDAQLAQGKGREVAASDGLVFEFTVTLPGMLQPMTVWRYLDDNRVPDLRLAPAPDDEEAHATLLNQMQAGAKMRAGRRREKLATAVGYGSKSAAGHWNGVRKAEFGQYLEEWNTATGKSHSGGAMLQCLSELCDAQLAQGRGTEVTGSGGLVFEFAVTLPGMLEPMTVWRHLDDNGVPDLRLAPAPDDEEAHATLLKQIQTSAKVRAGRRRETLAAAVPYDAQVARGHWKVRKAEFGQCLEEWNTATGKSHSGAAMLQRLSSLCDAELAQGRGAEVTGSGGLVFEFTVTLPGMLEPMTVWRHLDDNGVPDLRLAPAPDDEEAHATRLNQMQAGAKMRAGRRRETLAAAVPYDAQVARRHWKVRKAEFGQCLEEWNTATGKSNSGAAMLQRLSSLCDAELVQGRGAEVAGSDGLVFEFTVTLPGMLEQMTVWRGLDDNQVPNLRLASVPGDDQARATLLRRMQTGAKMRAGHRRT